MKLIKTLFAIAMIFVLAYLTIISIQTLASVYGSKFLLSMGLAMLIYIFAIHQGTRD